MVRSRPPLSALSIPTLIGALALFGCDQVHAPEGPSAPARAGEVAIHIAPLTLGSVDDATWRLTVANAGGDPVWTRDITADAYGDGAGSVSYVGPCDADGSPPDNTVTVELLELRAAGGAVIPESTYMIPPPATRTVRCVEGADVAVDFDITVARAAQQGFFDFAISFDDIFCSAKVDCVDALLHQPGGGRGPTAVVALACTADTAADDTWLYLDDLQIDCTGRSATVDPSAGPGNLVEGEGFTQSASPVLYGAQVTRGAEQLGFGKLYWNVLLGLETGAASCQLTTAATAHAGAFADGTGTPAGSTWPYIDFDVTLTDGGGAMSCDNHGLNAAGSGVAVTYTPSDTPKTFGYSYDGAVASATALPPEPVAYEAATLGDDFGFDYGFMLGGFFDEATPKIPFAVQNYSASNQARVGMLTLDDATHTASVSWVGSTLSGSNNFTLAQLDGRNLLRGRRVWGQWDCFVAGYQWGDSAIVDASSDFNQGNQRYLGVWRLSDTRGFAYSASNYQSVRMFDYSGGSALSASATRDYGQAYGSAVFIEWDGDLVIHTKTNPVTTTAGTFLLLSWSGANGAALTEYAFTNLVPSGMSSTNVYGKLVRTSYGAFLVDSDTNNTWQIGRTGNTLTVDDTGTWASPPFPLTEIQWNGVHGMTGKYTKREVATDVFETLRVYTDASDVGHVDSVRLDLSDFANPTVTVLQADLYTYDATLWTFQARNTVYRPGTDDVLFALYRSPISGREGKLVYVENAF